MNAPAAKNACPVWVGTSGYSYTEWVDAGFYPRGTPTAKMLPHYVERFPTTELNYTWYQMPRAEAVERQRRKTPASFLFSLKLTRTMTHDVDPQGWRQQVAAFRDGLAPLGQGGQLAAVLVQLPPSFDYRVSHRRHLGQLLDELAGLPLAVEFRNDSWATDRVFQELSQRQVSLVAVDEPQLPGLFPALDVVTCADHFYVRFHGRNHKGWYSGQMNNQFDYDYTDEELVEWVEQRILHMARQARRGFIYFNNHVRGQAPRNAEALRRILRQQGLKVMEP